MCVYLWFEVPAWRKGGRASRSPIAQHGGTIRSHRPEEIPTAALKRSWWWRRGEQRRWTCCPCCRRRRLCGRMPPKVSPTLRTVSLLWKVLTFKPFYSLTHKTSHSPIIRGMWNSVQRWSEIIPVEGFCWLSLFCSCDFFSSWAIPWLSTWIWNIQRYVWAQITPHAAVSCVCKFKTPSSWQEITDWWPTSHYVD